MRGLSNERITAIGEAYLGQGKFEEAFKYRFGAELPETLNENHSLLIVASHIDASSERIITYLSDTYGVNINAASFQYFKEQSGAETGPDYEGFQGFFRDRAEVDRFMADSLGCRRLLWKA